MIPPITEIISAVLPILIELIDALLPIIQILIDLLMPVIDCFIELLAPILSLISEAITPLLEALTPIIEVISDLLIPILQMLMSVFSEVFAGIVTNITDKIGRMTNIINSIVDFVKNVFTGNWKGAWENVKNIFKNIAEGIGAAFKSPINYIIDLLNGFIKGINKIKIPDWVPAVGGKGITIPTIPRLRVGMDYIPSDDFPAFLHKGEAVLTAQENALYRSVGGFEGIMQALSCPVGTSEVYVTVKNDKEDSGFDYERMAEANTKAMEGITVTIDGKRAGKLLAKPIDEELGKIDRRRT